MRPSLFVSLILTLPLALSSVLPVDAQAPARDLAPTPPMGWNSWDSYGIQLDEPQLRKSAQWIAQHLKPSGYEYLIVDQGWYVADASKGDDDPTNKRFVDAYGRYIPAPNRFPSSANGAGFAPLADYVHSLGLKFGLHILQGIPKRDVAANTPIEGSSFHAKDAANPTAGCVWNPLNEDLQENEAAQAWYDSLARLYASWHVDFIKIDCISSRPYKGEEIRMFHEAVAKAGAASGRPMVVSLSPGATPLDEAANVSKYSQQWRVADDLWDVWQSNGSFPQGINDQFERAAKWLPFAGPGHWPDLDMLPLGELRPSPGWGSPRRTRLTPDEQRSVINLWAIVRAPLIYGGEPESTDAATLALLTNQAVLEVDQHSHNNRNVVLTPKLAVFTAQAAAAQGGMVVAAFNRNSAPQTVSLSFEALGLREGSYAVEDLWSPGSSHPETGINVTLPPHASAMLRVTPREENSAAK